MQQAQSAQTPTTAATSPAKAPGSSSGARTRQLSYGEGQRALSPRERGAQAEPVIAPLAERFGVDLSALQVHLHNDGALGDVKGYTRGSELHLAINDKALATPDGKRLIAHELTHVVQQRQGSASTGVTTEMSLEDEADSAADKAVRGERPKVDLRARPSTVLNKKAAPKTSALTPAQVSTAVQWYGVRQNQYTSAVAKRIQQTVGTYPDGDIGPITVRAIATWQASKGLTADGYAGAITLTAMFGEDIRGQRPDAGDTTGKEHDDEQLGGGGGLSRPNGLSQITKTFGKAGTSIGTFTMRAGTGGKNINVPAHKKVGPLFQRVYEDIHKDGKSDHIHSYDGCYVYRTKRKSSSAFSTHAWGIAIDVNASANPMQKNSKPSDSQKVLAPYFEKHGFYWGQAFGDPMHFQYCTGY